MRPDSGAPAFWCLGLRKCNVRFINLPISATRLVSYAQDDIEDDSDDEKDSDDEGSKAIIVDVRKYIDKMLYHH